MAAVRVAVLALWLSLALAVAVEAVAGPVPVSATKCCPPGVALQRHKHRSCSDGSRLALDCGVMFVLDRQENEDDEYELQPDGTLHIGNVTIQRFCEALMPGGPGPGRDSNATHDVVLVCHTELDPDDAEAEAADNDHDPRPQWWFDVASALSWLSVACLALTLAAHVLLPELRDLQGRCHMGAVASLGLALLVLAVLQAFTQEGVVCTTLAFLGYYWFMSAFIWLNITSFNVWRSVVLERVRFREGALYAWYCALSWGVPLAQVLALLAVHLLPRGGPDDAIVRPRFGDNKCWFHDDRATWAWFYWPLAALLTMNTLYFVWTTVHLCRQYGAADRSCRGKLLRRRILLSLKLFLIMGISWVFELISSATDVPGNIAWYITDTFNAMQGVVILVVLVLTRRRAWRALYRRRPCGLRPPAGWAFGSAFGDRVDDCGTSTDSEDDDDDDDVAPRELKDMSAAKQSISVY